MPIFDRWGVRHTGLFTFAQSPKHVALYQKFGYWPRYLTAIMTNTPAAAGAAPVLLSAGKRAQREAAIEACRKLTHKIDKGLDLTGEIRAVLALRTGDVVLTYTRTALDGFALCLNGPGSEGGETICYVKFAAARGGPGAGERLDKLLAACEAFAASRGASVEAGVNLAREHAYQRMRARGYRVTMQGVAMHVRTQRDSTGQMPTCSTTGADFGRKLATVIVAIDGGLLRTCRVPKGLIKCFDLVPWTVVLGYFQTSFRDWAGARVEAFRTTHTNLRVDEAKAVVGCARLFGPRTLWRTWAPRRFPPMLVGSLRDSPQPLTSLDFPKPPFLSSPALHWTGLPVRCYRSFGVRRRQRPTPKQLPAGRAGGI